jgi:hypothetical protein
MFASQAIYVIAPLHIDDNLRVRLVAFVQFIEDFRSCPSTLVHSRAVGPPNRKLVALEPGFSLPSD